MFGMKSKKEKLEAKLQKLLTEAYELSHTNRSKSDEKTADAEELRKQIDAMNSA
jgi:polyhydroxyalkanoate synthesis regulator phasin